MRICPLAGETYDYILPRTGLLDARCESALLCVGASSKETAIVIGGEIHSVSSHAYHSLKCFEVAKTPRPPPVSTKSKSSSQSKSKGKEREALRPAPIYDYHDSSLHDIALRAHLQRGYEEFKVGSPSFGAPLWSNISC